MDYEDTAEIVEVNNNNGSFLPAVNVEAVVAYFDDYQTLTKKLLKPSDYQPIKDKNGKVKKFKKKSAWRKYATAFNISDRVISEDINRDDDGRIISATFKVEASLPTGRKAIGVGVSSIFDKINWKDTVEPSHFELRKRFSNAEHDIISTAHTRAKSRAISDIMGTGEVSAEEMGDDFKEVAPKVRAKTVKPKTTPKVKKEKVIDVEKVAKAKPSIGELAQQNRAINLAVKELQANDEKITNAIVLEKVEDLYEQAKFSKLTYTEAKAKLE